MKISILHTFQPISRIFLNSFMVNLNHVDDLDLWLKVTENSVALSFDIRSEIAAVW